jgi:adenosylcobyric acid synthase
MAASDYQRYRPGLLPEVLESFHTLAREADIVLVEGAGSPAEINLRSGDIANMGFARAAGCPVVLIGDIERGGVIASLVGTATVLEPQDRAMIRGFLVNKFRGDARLFDAGAQAIEDFTGWPFLGLIPYGHDLRQLPQEDSLALAARHEEQGDVHIAVLLCPHIANFDDLDPLQNQPGVRVSWCRAGEVIPADAAMIILPGSKSTAADLAFIRRQGWDIDMRAHVRRGGRVLGLCGGYQMLGKILFDPDGVEGAPATVEGLGLLDVDTVFAREKKVTPWQGMHIASAAEVSGYEIHMGVTAGGDTARPLFSAAGGMEGACSVDGRVAGTYIHGLFANDGFRRAWLQSIGAAPAAYAYRQHMQRILDEWADTLEASVAIDRLLALSQPV